MEVLHVTEVRLVEAGPQDRRRGLLGWVSCTLNDRVRLDGITLRRTAGGRTALSFPERRDGAGRRHAYFRPVDDEARRAIESQVLAGLRQDGWTPDAQ